MNVPDAVGWHAGTQHMGRAQQVLWCYPHSTYKRRAYNKYVHCVHEALNKQLGVTSVHRIAVGLLCRPQRTHTALARTSPEQTPQRYTR